MTGHGMAAGVVGAAVGADAAWVIVTLPVLLVALRWTSAFAAEKAQAEA
jgi:hypothetical protein